MCQTSGESRIYLKGDGPFKAEGAGGGGVGVTNKLLIDSKRFHSSLESGTPFVIYRILQNCVHLCQN